MDFEVFIKWVITIEGHYCYLVTEESDSLTGSKESNES